MWLNVLLMCFLVKLLRANPAPKQVDVIDGETLADDPVYPQFMFSILPCSFIPISIQSF